jgi:aryl-alcohol dehydrogenase-like predicted oxidoreductase
MSTPMTRTLGRSGIEISAMGLGCWAIGGPFWKGETPLGWGEVDDEESIAAIHAALDKGVTFFDTADVYGAGHSERVLARALQGRREEVVIASKFGHAFEEDTKQVTGGEASPDYIRQACEDSLRRLERDYIDLYQFHLNEYDPDEAPEVRETLEELVAEGKIRAYGWSTAYPERAAVFAEGENCASVQFPMNVLEDAPEMVALCEEQNLAGINRAPLAMGALSGKYTPDKEVKGADVRSASGPGQWKYFENGKIAPEWHRRREAIREILTSGGRSLVQGALCWLWARSETTVPIPGFRTVEQVTENAGAMEYGPLSSDQMDEIDRILDRG